MNNIQLSGRLFGEPKGNYFKNGALFVVRFLLVVPRVMKKADIEAGKRSVDFVPCFMFGKSAELLAKSVGKGDRIVIDSGVWHTESYTKDGKMIYTNSCQILHFEFGTTKADSSLNDLNVVTGEDLENMLDDFKLDSCFME